MASEVAIKVEHVSKNFVLPHEKITSVKSAFTNLYKKKNKNKETQHALKDISFNIKKGEFFGIVGRNGSGKSTMLKILAGIYQPSEGAVHTHGKLVPFIELGVGFNAELTGRENVYLNGAMLGFSRKEIDAMYDGIVSFAELERFMDQKLKNYSSGMQVRLAFSMATRSEADILLVDEVLAVGDADFQRKCFDYFRQLKKNKKTVVFVSHDMNAIREYCERAALIDDSKLVTIDTSERVAKEYLRLFNPVEYDLENKKRKTGNRWGSGNAEIKSVKLKKALITREDDFIEFAVSVIAHQDFMDSIIPGFSIKNSAGQLVCGTNSIIEQLKLPVITAGQTFTVKWKVANIFNDDTYTIEPAIADGKDQSICQWWDNASSFEVINDKKTPYIVAPPVVLEWDI
jgi:ABC-2 type transport system ATP-binding protein